MPDGGDRNDDDAVGYCKPPKHSRFKKGQTGNPKGRPRHSKNSLTIWQEELNRSYEATIEGQRKNFPARVLIIKGQVRGALAQQRAAVENALEAMLRLDERGKLSDGGPMLSSADKDVIDSLIHKLRQANSHSSEATSAEDEGETGNSENEEEQ